MGTNSCCLCCFKLCYSRCRFRFNINSITSKRTSFSIWCWWRGGATGGISYDKAGGESSGAAGGSAGYISDVIYSVSGGSSYSYSIASGGNAGNQSANFGHPKIGSAGGTTSVTGLFSLSGGGGASLTGGGVQGPLASGSGGSAGSFSNSGTRITSGQYLDSSFNLQTIGSTSDLTGVQEELLTKQQTEPQEVGMVTVVETIVE